MGCGCCGKRAQYPGPNSRARHGGVPVGHRRHGIYSRMKRRMDPVKNIEPKKEGDVVPAMEPASTEELPGAVNPIEPSLGETDYTKSHPVSVEDATKGGGE